MKKIRLYLSCALLIATFDSFALKKRNAIGSMNSPADQLKKRCEVKIDCKNARINGTLHLQPLHFNGHPMPGNDSRPAIGNYAGFEMPFAGGANVKVSARSNKLRYYPSHSKYLRSHTWNKGYSCVFKNQTVGNMEVSVYNGSDFKNCYSQSEGIICCQRR